MNEGNHFESEEFNKIFNKIKKYNKSISKISDLEEIGLEKDKYNNFCSLVFKNSLNTKETKQPGWLYPNYSTEYNSLIITETFGNELFYLVEKAENLLNPNW